MTQPLETAEDRINGHRRCRGCLQLLPFEKLVKHPTSYGGCKPWCYKCYYHRHKTYKAKWHREARQKPGKTRDNVEKWNAHIKAINDEKRGVSLDHPAHCLIHRIPMRFTPNRVWKCDKCLRIAEKSRAAIKEKQRTIQRITIKYGSEIASLYEKHQAHIKPGGLHAKQTLFFALQDYIESQHGYRPSKEKVKRLTEINRVANLPIGNHRWTCAHCNLEHTNPWFFDLDHIEPRHKGGSDAHTNLRILCPSCHRLRHIEEFEK